MGKSLDDIFGKKVQDHFIFHGTRIGLALRLCLVLEALHGEVLCLKVQGLKGGREQVVHHPRHELHIASISPEGGPWCSLRRVHAPEDAAQLLSSSNVGIHSAKST